MSGMDFSPEILRPAAELFFEGGPDGISLLSSSEREEDVRAAVLAVKVATVAVNAAVATATVAVVAKLKANNTTKEDVRCGHPLFY